VGLVFFACPADSFLRGLELLLQLGDTVPAVVFSCL